MTQPAIERLCDDEPITLAEACKLYPRAKMTVSTLRAEANRGRLTIFKLGNAYHTTAEAMKEMVQRCRAESSHRASTSIQPETSGLSETDRVSSARAALRASVTALKTGLPRISGKSTGRRPAQTH